MGYFRHIIADRLESDGLCIVIDEHRAALRFLCRLNDVGGLRLHPRSDLLSTDRLASACVPFDRIIDAYETDGCYFGIFAEGILDNRTEEFKRLWRPGTHFVFRLDPYRGVRIDIKGSLTMGTLRNTAEQIRYEGGIWCFDLWVRNPTAPLTECSRSITTAPGTVLVTNLADLGEEWKAADVMTGKTSKWLALTYRLTSETPYIEPDGAVFLRFEVLDGKTGQIANDVNADHWIVDAVDGYAPKKRVTVRNGIGRFRVRALDLEDGDSMRIKIKSRYDSSLAECIIPVQYAKESAE